MTNKDIFDAWQKESQAANDYICEIIESYMEFIDIIEKTLNKCSMPQKIYILAQSLIAQRRKDWMPVLEKAKQLQKGEMLNANNTKI